MIIETGWRGFCAQVYPDGAPEIQLQDMRQAFFAGAAQAIGIVAKAFADENLSVEECLLHMKSINDELVEFINDYQLRHVETIGEMQ
jgi:hypothetical protein